MQAAASFSDLSSQVRVRIQAVTIHTPLAVSRHRALALVVATVVWVGQAIIHTTIALISCVLMVTTTPAILTKLARVVVDPTMGHLGVRSPLVLAACSILKVTLLPWAVTQVLKAIHTVVHGVAVALVGPCGLTLRTTMGTVAKQPLVEEVEWPARLATTADIITHIHALAITAVMSIPMVVVGLEALFPLHLPM